VNWRDLRVGDVIRWHYGPETEFDDLYLVIEDARVDCGYVRMSVLSLLTGDTFWESTRPNAAITSSVSIYVGGRREVE
jgi:hypothetical protein